MKGCRGILYIDGKFRSAYLNKSGAFGNRLENALRINCYNIFVITFEMNYFLSLNGIFIFLPDAKHHCPAVNINGVCINIAVNNNRYERY